MRYLDEYRDGQAAGRYAEALRALVTRPWTLMEVCGGQTHAIVRYGIAELLPPGLELIHGPGCPVCVTPVAALDRAIRLAGRAGVVLASFGDMLRVPGGASDLLHARAGGADVRVVYSPLDAVALAEREPGREVVFFAVGFETTAPANAMAVRLASRKGLRNFSLLVAQVRVPPALEAILAAPDARVQGFLAAGHVCAVMGTAEYHALAARHRVPVVVTGFEPLDLLQGVAMAVRQLEDGRADVEIQYARVVRPEGNPAARAAMDEVFEAADGEWRGLGVIPGGALRLRERWAAFDATRKFPDAGAAAPAAGDGAGDCLAGLVLRGRLRPRDCPAFGDRCTPEHPLGAPMVSSEGACAAYYRYRPRPAAAAATRAGERR